MDKEHTKILLIDDNPDHARLIQELLAEGKGTAFDLAISDRLSAGLERLSAGGIDVVLLDLSLPDSQGLETLARVCTQAPDVPAVVLTTFDAEAVAVQAVHEGAEDYLLKDQVTSALLVRTLRYAIERQELRAEVRSLSLTDDLTGLYNRRGFLILCEQQLRLARRVKAPQLLLFVDLDGLKQINDTLDREQGDRALLDVANILRRTCRQSDIIARLGEHEYAVLAIHGHDGAEAITARLEANLKVFQEKMDRPYTLSLSVGAAVYNPQRPCSMDELLAEAGESMSARKWHNQGKGSTAAH